MKFVFLLAASLGLLVAAEAAVPGEYVDDDLQAVVIEGGFQSHFRNTELIAIG